MRRRGPLKAGSPSGEYTSLQKGSFRTAFGQGVSNSSLQEQDAGIQPSKPQYCSRAVSRCLWELLSPGQSIQGWLLIVGEGVCANTTINR